MSVQFGIIDTVVMPGGWHYPQALSSGLTIKITAFDFEELLRSILDFRMRHIDLCGAESAHIESVRSDLKTYICKNFRQNCADANATPYAGIGVAEYHKPIDRSSDWLAQMANRRQEHVDLGLASQRAQICAQCQQNIRWSTSCGPCNDNVQIRIQNLKGNLRTAYDRHLAMCRIYGHVNEVAVWLKDTHSQSDAEPPPHCWKAQKNG